MTDEALVYLAMGCIKLRVLSVSLCPITDVGLRAIAGTLSSSTAAEILGTPALTFSFSDATNGYHPHPIASAFPLLPGARTRPVSESHAPVVVAGANANHSTVPSSPVSSSTLQQPAIVFGCKQLRVLEAAQCAEITDTGLAALAKNCVHVCAWLCLILCIAFYSDFAMH